MSAAAPEIYLINGDDEFEIARFIEQRIADLGDPSTALMNLTRLDGRTYNPDDLLRYAASMPFLSSRRMVILDNPTARFEKNDLREAVSKEEDETPVSGSRPGPRSRTAEARKAFLSTLERIPPTTVLLLVEYRLLTSYQDRQRNRLHWLESWAFAAGERVHIKSFSLPKDEKMTGWIMSRAKDHGGQFTRDAANRLAELVGAEPRLADQEILKLLEYVNYRRPVERDDVHLLTADTHEGNIFALVDAIGNHQLKPAIAMLERLLEEDDPKSIFPMIVRQFRLLLQAREVLDGGGGAQEVARQLQIIPFVADKISAQARRFTLPGLEQIYHRLLEIDLQMKTSQSPGELALETLVANLCGIGAIDSQPQVIR